ncbi:MAG: ABC transporter ATP-binding protein [Chloroflexota bacterium]|nr:ABC transporter ATP-binding protein [Chloroflexota bacterium]
MSGYLELRGLRKRFPNGTLAVDGVDLDVLEGEVVALLGPSGCGKTTTLRCIAGFEDPEEGTITLAGKRIDDQPPNRRGATMVFQGYALFPHLSVFENVAYGLRVRHIAAAPLRERVERTLALVGLTGYGERRPQQLSGGQQQRVALARALVLEPALLLFDEPLSNLDAKLREQLRLELRALVRRVGITSVYVTHDQAEAMTLADRIAVMERGRIAQLGTPRQIYDEPVSRFVADFVGHANFVPGTVRGVEGGTVVVDMLGAPHRAAAPSPLAVGDAVSVMIRPEEIVVLPADAIDTIPATVHRASFLGSEVVYQLSCSGSQILATAPLERGAPLPSDGDPVSVRVREAALRAFRAS